MFQNEMEQKRIKQKKINLKKEDCRIKKNNYEWFGIIQNKKEYQIFDEKSSIFFLFFLHLNLFYITFLKKIEWNLYKNVI